MPSPDSTTSPTPLSVPSIALPEVSVVIPCLNESETVATCVAKAVQCFREHGLAGEVVVADNGSTDGSQALAEAAGARVVAVAAKGYGNALMGGIAAARAPFVVLADADDSYDLREVHRFVEVLRKGADLVQGCRLPSGGGKVMPGAMPWLHRWVGNPLFSFLVRQWFRAPIHDVNCGYRGFRKDLISFLDMRCTGMEFAVEMVIKSCLHTKAIAEVPIILYPDGRVSRRPHLRTFRDGWRTLRFYLLYCPRWLFVLPGLALIFAGGLGYVAALLNLPIGAGYFGVNTLMVSSLLILMGYQSLLFGFLTKVFGVSTKLMPEDQWMTRLFRWVTLERGLLLGGLSFLLGCSFIGMVFFEWWHKGFGALDYFASVRWVVPGFTLAALGFQTVLGSFFFSLLGLHRK